LIFHLEMCSVGATDEATASPMEICQIGSFEGKEPRFLNKYGALGDAKG
jgi:hypothetical protein